MYLSIIFIPLLSAFISGLLGRKVGIQGSQFISCTLLTFASILALIAFYEVGLNESTVYFTLFNWIDSEFLLLNWGFLFDSLSVSMLLPVLWVSTAVHFYSIGYMKEDPAICSRKTLIGNKLPNSGKALKLMIPNQSRKTLCGWINNSCRVTSHKIDENKIGNCGSKSVALTVKEQRVDGSWGIEKYIPMPLRCTLMGFERNYQIRNLSKQLYIKNFSTLNSSSNINP